ncbi:MAG TPA: DegT/DnrJ/EryC1/StrS family aminotransferase, partial [Vicinamibacteria bacterium]|nr:DegT/DnrJ/EryC1/StrS family aminotransferase [Vicinamibacteria bacterium]
RHDVGHALATTSCTTALHLILAAMGIGPGDEVIVPAFTWVATANAVVYCGGTPVLVDVDDRTFNIDPAQVKAHLGPRTRAIIAVHLFGLAADLDALAAVAPGVPIVEDAACAAGSSYRGRPVGGLARAAAFSFHPRKAITTGEGGMVTTDDDELAEAVNVRRNHGAAVSEEQRHKGSRPYLLPEFDVLGFNFRMTDIQGALGLVQLGKLDRFIGERRRWAAYYDEELAGIPWLRTPRVPEGYGHCWQSYVTYVDETRAPLTRNAIMEKLQERGIATRPGTHAVHTLGYYRETFGTRPEDCPRARDCDRFTMSIPLHNRMTAEDYAYVVEALRSLG